MRAQFEVEDAVPTDVAVADQIRRSSLRMGCSQLTTRVAVGHARNVMACGGTARQAINSAVLLASHRQEALRSRRDWIGPERRKEQPITIDWRLELIAAAVFMIGLAAFAWLAPLLPAIGRWIAP